MQTTWTETELCRLFSRAVASYEVRYNGSDNHVVTIGFARDFDRELAFLIIKDLYPQIDLYRMFENLEISYTVNAGYNYEPQQQLVESFWERYWDSFYAHTKIDRKGAAHEKTPDLPFPMSEMTPWDLRNHVLQLRKWLTTPEGKKKCPVKARVSEAEDFFKESLDELSLKTQTELN